MTIAPVLVIGAGPVGLTLANELARGMRQSGSWRKLDSIREVSKALVSYMYGLRGAFATWGSPRSSTGSPPSERGYGLCLWRQDRKLGPGRHSWSLPAIRSSSVRIERSIFWPTS